MIFQYNKINLNNNKMNLNNNYRYFRQIHNIVDGLTLFVIQKEIITDDNDGLYSYIYFLHNKTIPINELNSLINDKKLNLLSSLDTVWDFNEKKIGILGIHTSLNQRNKGYASLLIVISCIIAERFGLDIIELDDCSDNFKKQKNLYTNLSFRYIEDGFPEMIGSTKQIIRQWRRIKLKYRFNGDILKLLIPTSQNSI
jgi:hypothetical protein